MIGRTHNPKIPNIKATIPYVSDCEEYRGCTWDGEEYRGCTCDCGGIYGVGGGLVILMLAFSNSLNLWPQLGQNLESGSNWLPHSGQKFIC